MKKVLSLVMVLALMLVCFVACDNAEGPKTNEKDNSSVAAPSTEESANASASTEDSADVSASTEDSTDVSVSEDSADESASEEIESSESEADSAISEDVALGGDDAILGAWEATEDEVTLIFVFEEDGKGKLETMGITMDMIWSAADGKLNASITFMGETEEMLKDADYSLDGDSLSITMEGETVVFTRSNGIIEDSDTEISIALGGDDAIVGTWEATEEGVTVAFTFNADGTGKAETMGVEMDITWSAADGKLSASMSFMGTSEEMLADAEYSVDGDSLTIDDGMDVVVLTKK